jgi:hypothetical protein
VKIRSLVVVGAAVIVAAAAVAITLSAVRASSAVRAPSALAQLKQAVARTQAQSYKASATGTTVGPGGAASGPPVTLSGEFDTVRRVSEETSSQGYRERDVGGYVYVPVTDALRAAYNLYFHPPIPAGKSWLRIPIPQSRADMTSREVDLLAVASTGSGPVDPQDLLASLASAIKVREVGPASGSGWTGTEYAFTVPLPPLGQGVTLTPSITGTVGVDQQGRVRQVDGVQTIQVIGAGPEPATRVGLKLAATFGDFGLRVLVNPPPASETFIPPNQ